MTTNTQISVALAEAMLNAITTYLDAGGAGTIQIWSGTQPNGLETADAGTSLVTFTLNATAFAAAVASGNTGAVMTANSIANATAGNTGTAVYFTVYDHAGDITMRGSCGTSSADMILSTTSIVSGNIISITSWTVTMPTNGT